MKVKVNDGNTLHTPKGQFGPGKVVDIEDGQEMIDRGVASSVGKSSVPTAEEAEEAKRKAESDAEAKRKADEAAAKTAAKGAQK